MNNVKRTELRELTEPRKGPCVSIFLPASAAGADSAHDPLRLKNLLRRAELCLESQGWPPEAVEQVAHPIRDLVGWHSLWRHREEGLAVFSTSGFFRRYSVPFEVPELVVVANQFHLKPLFPAVEAPSVYYLLALSQCAVRLYRGDSEGLAPVDDLPLPRSPLASPVPERDECRPLPCHTSTCRGHRFLFFHGQSGRDERRKGLLFSYFRAVDEALRTRLGDDGAPVLLAGVGYLCSLYRHANRTARLLEDEIHGSPKRLDLQELRQRSWDIASAFFRSMRERVADEYYHLWYTPRASNDIQDIAVAARDGRIKTLFVAVGAPRWTRAAEEQRYQREDFGEYDLLNVAALDTFMAGGTVYAVSPEQVPGRGVAAAVFRY